ncbi:MAG: type 1 glutamine amidotransferase domain-containing protein, partial [Paraglaciecola chathamensis]
MKNVLIILTNHATLGTTDEANGTFSPELTHALHAFVEA